jgi:Flp pilus assembly protein TadG
VLAAQPANPIGSLQAQKLKSLLLDGRNKRQGASAVEFAFIAPIMVVLVLGMIEFGRVMMVEQLITNGARAGARFASLPGSVTGTQVTTEVNTALTGSGVSGHSVAVTPDPVPDVAGTEVRVTVSVPFNNVSWLAGPMFMGGRTLTATVVVRKEPRPGSTP